MQYNCILTSFLNDSDCGSKFSKDLHIIFNIIGCHCTRKDFQIILESSLNFDQPLQNTQILQNEIGIFTSDCGLPKSSCAT